MIIDKLRKQGCLYILKQNEKDYWRKAANFLFAQLEHAIVYDVSNVAEYTDGRDISSEEFPVIVPPHECMWLEYGGNIALSVMTKLVDESDMLPEKAMGARWLSFYQAAVEINGRVYLFPADAYVYIKPDGSFKHLTSFQAVPGDDVSQIIVNNIPIAFVSIAFAHCKNVTTHTHEYHRRIRNCSGKKISAKVTHRTLTIDPMKKVLETEGDIQHNGIAKALHICRGHFKDYRNSAGLFGKYKGLYWWDMHTRGTEKAGVVIKDYRVKAPAV
jgi:hypothetical protein